MIVNKKPESKSLEPVFLRDIITGNRNFNINVIEATMQRELVWSYENVETLWQDTLQCIKENIGNYTRDVLGNKIFNNKYLDLGNIEYSTVDKINQAQLKPLEKGEYRSDVDGSQRNRLEFFNTIAFLYERQKINGFDNVDLSYLKSSNGEFKLIEVGDDKLSKFCDFIESSSIDEIGKRIKPNEWIQKHDYKEDDKERDYFNTFALFVNFIEETIIGTYNIDDCIQIVLNNIYFYVEKIEEEHKFNRFVDRNKKGTPMSDESMYPKFIINQFDGEDKLAVYNSFVEFKEVAKETQDKNKEKDITFRRTKSGVDAILYIMIEVLKSKLAEEFKTNKDIDLSCVFSSTFNLGNTKYGIDKCFSKGLVFKSASDAIEYFNECKKLALFLLNESFKNHSTNIYKDCYYLRDFSRENVLWWYFIKPTYIIHSKFDNETYMERFKFCKKLLYRIYVFYIVYRSSNTNSQNLINMLEDLSKHFIIFNGDEEQFEQEAKKRFSDYINNAGGFDGLNIALRSLSYGVKTHRNAIENVFIALEYDLCEKCSLSTDTFFTYWKRINGKKLYNLDHWYPENKFKNLDDKTKFEYNRIGNLVLLEDSLNKSKQDNNEDNVLVYAQSKCNQTVLLNKNNRGAYKNETLEKINKHKYLTRFEPEAINNPTLENIEQRTDNYADFFVKFIKDFIE